MQVFLIKDTLYQSSAIDDIETANKFDVCIDLSGDVDLGAGKFKVYLKWSIADNDLPDLDILYAVARYGYDMAFKKKMKVLVHCNEGINRASLVNGLILWMDGMRDGKAIIDHIRNKRPGALSNPYFVNYLENLK